jgi:hypothetical protein
MNSVRARFWIEIFAMVTAIACVLALLLAILGMAAGAAAKDPPAQAEQSSAIRPTATRPAAISAQTYEGIISDGRCGAKHSARLSRMAADCTLLCVRDGEQFVLVNGDKMYTLEGDPVALKHAAGERVTIVGTRNRNSISVLSVGSPVS